jgi:hypothetical protein
VTATVVAGDSLLVVSWPDDGESHPPIIRQKPTPAEIPGRRIGILSEGYIVPGDLPLLTSPPP